MCRHMCGAAGGLGHQASGSGQAVPAAEAASRAAQARAAAAAPIQPAANPSGPASSAPSGVGSQPGSNEEEKLQQLQAFGASRTQALEALRAAGGNMELAASLLFDQNF